MNRGLPVALSDRFSTLSLINRLGDTIPVVGVLVPPPYHYHSAYSAAAQMTQDSYVVFWPFLTCQGTTLSPWHCLGIAMERESSVHGSSREPV
jgi:hypothetical protein